MKKLNIFVFAILGAVLVGCVQSGETTPVNNGVTVVSSQTEIPAAGGNGKVVVSKAVSNAYSKVDWLSVSTQGSEVSVKVNPNGVRDSRHGSLVIKASAQDSVVVAVSQSGIIYNCEDATDLGYTNEAATGLIPIYTDQQLGIVSCPSWVKATLNPDNLGIDINVSENNTGEGRAAWIKWEVGTYRDSISVSQFEPEDIYGDYLWTADEEGYLSRQYVTVSETDIYFWEEDWTHAVTYDKPNLQLIVANGTYVGSWTPTQHIFNNLVIGGDFSIEAKTTAALKFSYDLTVDAFVARLVGADGFIFNVFIGEKVCTEDNYLGYTKYMEDIHLQKLK